MRERERDETKVCNDYNDDKLQMKEKRNTVFCRLIACEDDGDDDDVIVRVCNV